ncbi:hypothetical protein KUF54_06610 [Comamonas sp. Y33R10-2]|uniref:hypothetical protein n=1 Tax=Comamonas sp. Y33R10-2 TaxID=2853257 RepID=UPI001C5CBC20|nr:hypothetical protein [Comamonas sp. Y33R10-2]QXZ10866.1 hypothetical protein KUF54_06610 [Comamonas sp. Y33R10-2]
MSIHRPTPAARQNSVPRSDVNYVFTAIAVFLLASLILGTVAYQYSQYADKQEQARTERQAYKRYNDYLKSTQQASPEQTPAVAQDPAPAQAVQEAQAEATPPQPSMTEKLLTHPAVTPGPGFNAPGVQETGVAIIDAMGSAQANSKH